MCPQKITENKEFPESTRQESCPQIVEPGPLQGFFCPQGGAVTKSCPTLLIPWTIAHQAPLSMGFPRQEYWSGLPICLSRGSYQPRDWTPASYIGKWSLHWWLDSLSTEPPGKQFMNILTLWDSRIVLDQTASTVYIFFIPFPSQNVYWSYPILLWPMNIGL